MQQLLSLKTYFAECYLLPSDPPVYQIWVAWKHPLILIVHPHSTPMRPQLWVIDTSSSILLPHLSFNHPWFWLCIVKFLPPSSKCPPNSAIFDNILRIAFSFLNIWVVVWVFDLDQGKLNKVNSGQHGLDLGELGHTILRILIYSFHFLAMLLPCFSK